MSKTLATLAILTALCTTVPARASEDYGKRIGNKALSAVGNLTLGWVEIPKNMINTSNQVNLLFGVTGGLFKGMLHTVGRAFSGTADLLTFPIPTQPIAQPTYVWQNFNTETHYGPIFKANP